LAESIRIKFSQAFLSFEEISPFSNVFFGQINALPE
jgi:hypothetical protein